MAKYKDSLYPDKINDFIDNEGALSEGAKELVKEAAGGDAGLVIDFTSDENVTVADFLTALGFNATIHTDANQLTLKNVTLKYRSIIGHYTATILFEKIAVCSMYNGSYLSFSANSSIEVNSTAISAQAYSYGGSYSEIISTSLDSFLHDKTNYLITPSISNIRFPDVSNLDSSKTYVLKLQFSLGSWKIIAIEE